MPTNGMTIDSLNTVSSLTAQDEVPVWDKEASGEPTRKITAQNMTNSVKTLGSLVNTTEMNNAIAQSTADVIRTGDVVNSLTSTETDKPLSANMGRALNEKRQLTITAGTHTAIDENNSYICGNVMVINFKCHATSAIGSSETIAVIEKTTVFNNVVPFFIGGEWTVTGVIYGYVTGKSVIAGNVNNGQYIHVNFTTLLA